MATTAPPTELPSLLGVTIRRTLIVGKVTVTVGSVMMAIYAAAFGFGGSLLISIGSIVMPIFAVSGGLGGVLVFSNDRTKGVLEYLVAYGVSPRRILRNVLVAGMVVVTIVLAIGVGAGLTTYLLSGHTLNLAIAEVFLGYTFPMSYLTVCLMTALGVFWTSLSSPRSGLNSPLGFLPLFGVMPTAGGLLLALSVGSAAPKVLAGLEIAIAVVVLSLFTRADRLMPPERLLSPT